MKIRKNEDENKEQFPYVIIFNSEKRYFTKYALKELRDEVDEILSRKQHKKLINIKKSKCCKAEVTTRLEEEKRSNNYSTNYYICKECLKPCDVI